MTQRTWVSLCFFVSLFTASFAWAGHPASDHVLNALDEAARIQGIPDSAKPQAVCRFIDRYVDHGNIAIRLLGQYAQSSDTTGVNRFRNEAESIMATKAMPELRKLAGESGSYSVSPNASARGSNYAVSVSIRRANGKTYNGTAIVSSAMKIIDVEYMGFSGVNYAGNELRKELDALRRQTNTPVSAYIQNMKSKGGYINCP